MAYSVPDDAADRVEALSRNRAGLRAARQEADRTYAVMRRALDAFAPEAKTFEEFPDAYMPRWLAALIQMFDNGIAEENAPAFLHAFAERSRRWRVLPDEAWARMQTQFLYACVRHAVDAAAARQPAPPPDYWMRAETVSESVLAALLDESDLHGAASAARDEMERWSSEAVGSDPSMDEAPSDALWAAKYAVETIDSAVDTARKGWEGGAAATADMAAITAGAGSTISEEAKKMRWTLCWQLLALIDTEIAAQA
jgi:hypothetical protein